MESRLEDLEQQRKRLESLKVALEVRITAMATEVPPSSMGGRAEEEGSADSAAHLPQWVREEAPIEGEKQGPQALVSLNMDALNCAVATDTGREKPEARRPATDVMLSFTPIKETHVSSTAPIMYSKGVQTAEKLVTKMKSVEPERSKNDSSKNDRPEDDSTEEAGPAGEEAGPAGEEAQPRRHAGGEARADRGSTRVVEPDKKERAEWRREAAPQVVAQEAECIMRTSEFAEFFNSATRIIERILAGDSDVCADYGELLPESTSTISSDSPLKVESVFCCDTDHITNRIVRDISWSHAYPELFLSTYVAPRPSRDSHSDGLVMVWNSRFCRPFQSKPEFTFEFTNTVKVATFSKDEPFLVLGGTSTGLVVQWDIRCARRTPCSTSLFSQGASNSIGFEIVAIKAIEGSHSNTVLTVSADHKVHLWKLSMLSKYERILSKGNCNTYGFATCGDLRNSPSEPCIIGTDQGALLVLHSSSSSDSDKGDLIVKLQSPVTSVAIHEPSAEIDFSHLFLSTSLDCSLRMWNSEKRCQLFIKDRFDRYVLDARWCPTHPAVFATADALGNVNIWCTNKGIRRPLAHYCDPSDGFYSKIAWSADGSHLALANCEGKVKLLAVDKSLVIPEPEDFTKFYNLTEQMCQYRVNEHKPQEDQLLAL